MILSVSFVHKRLYTAVGKMSVSDHLQQTGNCCVNMNKLTHGQTISNMCEVYTIILKRASKFVLRRKNERKGITGTRGNDMRCNVAERK